MKVTLHIETEDASELSAVLIALAGHTQHGATQETDASVTSAPSSAVEESAPATASPAPPPLLTNEAENAATLNTDDACTCPPFWLATGKVLVDGEAVTWQPEWAEMAGPWHHDACALWWYAPADHKHDNIGDNSASAAESAPDTPETRQDDVEHGEVERPGPAAPAAPDAPSPPAVLGRREAEYWQLQQQGLSYREIASRMGISLGSAQTYASIVRKKIERGAATPAVINAEAPEEAELDEEPTAPACTCSVKYAVATPGSWHEKTCPLYEAAAPPNAPCSKCEAAVVTYRELDGEERRCLNGHIQYPADFVPLERDETKDRHREPRHGGARL